MRRTVETAFTLMTVAEVGESLFASRPVMVVDGASYGLLFLNAAAAERVGASDLATVFGRPPALPAAILTQLARFGARAAVGRRQTELVTHRDGLTPVVTACTMTRLPDLDEAPVLLLELPARPGAPGDIAASLALLADPARLLAAFDADGEVLSASGDYALLDGVQDAIEDFVVAAANRPLARTRVAAADGMAEAMVARIGGTRDLRIIAIERVATPAAAGALEVSDAKAVGDAPAVEDSPAIATRVAGAAAPVPAQTAVPARAAPDYRDLGEPDHLLDPIFFALSPVPGPEDFSSWAAEPAATPDPATASAAPTSAADEVEAAADDALFAGFAAPLPHAPLYPGATSDDLRLAVDLVTHPPETLSPPTVLPDPAPDAKPALDAEPDVALEPAVATAPEDAAVRAIPAAAVTAVAATGAAASRDGDRLPPVFRFVPEARPSRFVWRMDSAGRFTFVSDDLARAVGPQAAALAGLTWAEARARLELDPDDRVAEALGRRQTWTVRDLAWPVEGQALRVPVDLTALPTLTRDRSFEGYQGFGLCRTGAPLPDPDATGERLAAPAASDEIEPPARPGAHAAETGPDRGVGPSAIDAAGGDAPDEVEPRRSEDPLPAVDEAAFAGEIVARTEIAPEDRQAEAADAPASDDAPGPATAALPAGDWAAADLTAGDLSAGDRAAGDRTAEDRAVVSPVYPVPAEIVDGTRLPADAEPAAGTQAERLFRPSDSGRVVTVPANRGSRVVTLPGAHRVAIDTHRLSAPERIAFRQIAAALGARLEGDDAGSDSEEPEPGPQPGSEPGSEAPAGFDATRSGQPDAVAPAEIALPAPGGTPAAIGSAQTTIAPGGFAPPGSGSGSGSAAIMAFARPTASAASAPEPAAEIEPATVIEPLAAPSVATQSSTTQSSAIQSLAAPSSAAQPVVAQSSVAQPATSGDDDVRLASRILDRLPVGCAVLREDDLVYVNGAFLTLTGYADLADLEASGGLDVLFAGEHVGRRFAEEGRTRPVPVLTRTGEVVPVAARLAPVPWGAGPALLLTLDRLPRPIAEAAGETASGRAALEALGEARERSAELEAIVDTATDGVIMLDGDGQVLSANRAAEALFGMDRAEMMGQGLDELLAPESRRSAQDYLDGLARNGVASVLNDGREVIGQVRPEGLIPLFMTIGRISSGAGSKFCAVLRDITQWKKSEEELTGARRRAEEASMHKSEFLAKISHEIRTPLNAIIGFSEVMLDERFGPVGTERYKDYLRDIHSSGSHIMSLINDLLDLSKVEAGKLELTFEAVSLADLAAECVAMMQPQANRERIIIRTSLPGSVPPVVADSRSVRQIVLNLLSNAVKFTPAGGQVIVSAALEDSGEVVLRVRDTGYGMTEKEIQAALEPFRQLHTARARSTGTGLGLPLTKALVEANRAAFRIDSAVNQGTLVTVTFPVTRVLAG
ncbi:PAS domain S-box protein [Prosthecomicrobium hirschii]|uniref:PAS domain-containing sensor histidine kinase n=1 Tax=Prosthecodimorpha hirschii TaxID=665126 RepID=UPI00221FFA5E|nr:PAS domain S-box protein [Prosthecomicrobium hirschii]MCW1843883.1 PAS domain S-box protein [Prosthecomicrobium hirschii]